MATADQPAGLMDIASSLSQDDIPFKLRCAICNNLALNAFRLPCCDQAICESCQESLPETCPVCAHTPISSDLCKPNKALRTTLKAFLRTEEKKREKERQSATPAVTNGATPAEDAVPPTQETPAASNTPDVATKIEPVETPSVADIPAEPSIVDSQPNGTHANDGPETSQETSANVPSQTGNEDSIPAAESANPADPTDQVAPTTEGDDMEETPIAQSTEQDDPQDLPTGSMLPKGMGMGMTPGMFPNMGWNPNADFNNPMSQFMGNGMFNFQNPMAMPGMAMNPMAANQGMFGGYGMNMNGMNSGMNMGMNYDAGQGMYGGWDGGGAQNNMWNGGQDKFNPNAFANGMGPQYGPASSGFGGYNANGLPQHPQQDFSPNGGYYGPGRGNFRGRGRGFGYMSGPGAGRGRGFPGNPADYPNAHSPAFPDNPLGGGPATDMASATQEEARPDEQAASAAAVDVNGDAPDQPSSHAEANTSANGPGDGAAVPGATDGQTESEDPSQLRGIPTIDSLDQANAAAQGMMMPTGPMGMMGSMGPGYGRGGNFMRGGPYGGGRGPYIQGPNMHAMPRGPGVEGAPAAPRAMRQGLPNTSVLRQRNFQGSGSARSSVPSMRPSEPPQSAANSAQPQDEQPTRSTSGSRSRAASVSRPRSRTRSPAPSHADSRAYRQRSPSVADGRSKPLLEDPDRRSERPRRPRRREDKYDGIPAPEDDRRTRSPSAESRRSSRRRDRERDRDRDRERDRRSGRRSHRSHRHRSASRNGETDRLADIPEENGRGRTPAVGDSVDTASRTGRSTKDGSSRRDDERERDRDTRRRDRHRDRDRDRVQDRDRDRERDRDRYRERDRGDRDRERDRKRSRRDRSQSPPMDSEYSSRRRNKRTRDDMHDEPRSRDKPASDQPEKDPHTLEREARNRERMQKEQQRREAALQGDGKSARRRDSRALGGGRRVNYKYEDEENDSARAARVEKEREAARWG